MDNKLHIGLIGFGRLGSIHAQNIANSAIADLYAVCDLNTDALERAHVLYGAKTATNLEEFLEHPLDGVVIASSTSQHLDNIRAITKKGIPIFTEKPIGLTLEETDAVLQEVVNAGVPFQIGFQRRWDPRFKKIKEIIESGEIGRPVLLKTYGRDPNASKPENWGLDKNGGLFLNAAIHDYDTARFLFGSEVTKLTASGAALVYNGLATVGDIDTCSTTLFMEGNTMAMTEWSRYATYGYDIGMEIIGTEGVARIGREYAASINVNHKNDNAPSVFEVFADAYKAEIDGFLHAIAEHIPMTPSVEDARIALHIALQARKSFEDNSQAIACNSLEPLDSKTS